MIADLFIAVRQND